MIALSVSLFIILTVSFTVYFIMLTYNSDGRHTSPVIYFALATNGGDNYIGYNPETNFLQLYTDINHANVLKVHFSNVDTTALLPSFDAFNLNSQVILKLHKIGSDPDRYVMINSLNGKAIDPVTMSYDYVNPDTGLVSLIQL